MPLEALFVDPDSLSRVSVDTIVRCDASDDMTARCKLSADVSEEDDAERGPTPPSAGESASAGGLSESSPDARPRLVDVSGTFDERIDTCSPETRRRSGESERTEGSSERCPSSDCFLGEL